MYVLLWDPQSPVRLLFTDANGKKGVWLDGTAADLWPSLAQVGTAMQDNRYTTDLTANYATNIRVKGRATPLVLPETEYYSWDAQRVVTKNYSERLHAGDVIMNPYSIGEVRVQRSLRIGMNPLKVTGSAGAQVGWLLNYAQVSAKMPGISFPPIRTYMGKIMRPEASMALLTWRWVYVPDSSVYLSPSVSFPDVLTAVIPDTALVTSVAADAANGTLDLLTELVELPQTMKFLGQCVSQACVLTADLEEEARKQRRRMPVSKFTKWLSSHWLKGRYALLPILYTIQDVQQVLAQMEQEYAEYRSKKEIASSFPFELPVGTICEDQPQTHRCYIRSRYTPDSLLASFRRLLNVNLASTLWETTTLSFVADWAFNIGDYISALTGSDGAAETACSYSVRNQAEYSVLFDSADAALQGLATSVKFNTYQRIIIDPSDHIGLTFDVQMNWKRSIDAFALFANPGIQRLERLLKRA